MPYGYRKFWFFDSEIDAGGWRRRLNKVMSGKVFEGVIKVDKINIPDIEKFKIISRIINDKIVLGVVLARRGITVEIFA